MNKRAIVVLADGFEEIEALAPVDLLRRAGLDVVMLGLTATDIRGSHSIVVKTDGLFDAFFQPFDALVLPGGPGHKNLLLSQKLLELIRSSFAKGVLCAAICAAPSVLGKAGILMGKKATCFPGYEDKLSGATFVEKKVVTDANVITSRGAGTSIEFGLEIITYLAGKEAADEVAEAIVFGA